MPFSEGLKKTQAIDDVVLYFLASDLVAWAELQGTILVEFYSHKYILLKLDIDN